MKRVLRECFAALLFLAANSEPACGPAGPAKSRPGQSLAQLSVCQGCRRGHPAGAAGFHLRTIQSLEPRGRDARGHLPRNSRWLERRLRPESARAAAGADRRVQRKGGRGVLYLRRARRRHRYRRLRHRAGRHDHRLPRGAHAAAGRHRRLQRKSDRRHLHFAQPVRRRDRARRHVQPRSDRRGTARVRAAARPRRRCDRRLHQPRGGCHVHHQRTRSIGDRHLRDPNRGRRRSVPRRLRHFVRFRSRRRWSSPPLKPGRAAPAPCPCRRRPSFFRHRSVADAQRQFSCYVGPESYLSCLRPRRSHER